VRRFALHSPCPTIALTMIERDSDEHVAPGGRLRSGHLAKRALDFGLGFVRWTLLPVPSVLIAFAIRLDSEGSIFFRQERGGKGGKLFRIWKLRTMLPGVAEAGLGRHASPDEAIVTRVGGFLREWGLNGLPQLLNVLRGEMSFVGPRPALPLHAADDGPGQRLGFAVKPRIAEWTLVKGRNKLSWKQRFDLNNWYIEHRSSWLGGRILLATLWTAFIEREGVYGGGAAGLRYQANVQ